MGVQRGSRKTQPDPFLSQAMLSSALAYGVGIFCMDNITLGYQINSDETNDVLLTPLCFLLEFGAGRAPNERCTAYVF